jgi:hypothetical protein
MFKAKMMNTFKDMFGGVYNKENGKIFWSKNGFKELVTTGFLKHFIDKKKDPSVNDQSTVVLNSAAKQPSKKVKKDAKPETNPEVSQGS